MDFLRTKDMISFLSKKTPPNFNAHLSLLRGYTAYVKTTRFPQFVDRTYFAQSTPSPFTTALREIIFHSKAIDASPEAYPLLDELDACIPEMERKGQVKMNALGDPTNTVLLVFRELLLDSCMVGYLDYRMPLDSEFLVPVKGPVLARFVAALMGHCDEPTVNCEEIGSLIRCLLENGCDPNETYMTKQPGGTLCARTPWQDLVLWPTHIKCPSTHCREMSLARRASMRMVLESVLALMLEHGADRSVWPGTDVPDVSWRCL